MRTPPTGPAPESSRVPVMSKLSHIALSLAVVGSVQVADANYRMVYKVRQRGRGCCGPVAPPMIPWQAGVPMSIGPSCCGNVIAPAMPVAPAQPMLMAPVPSACGPSVQPVVSFQDVPRTQIQRQAVSVNVPVTTYNQVTVDQGSYQQVWVPRPVTKVVPQTVMQSQIQYRDVAVQTVERIPQYHTVVVPQPQMTYVQSGIYVPQTAAQPETMPSISVPNPPAAPRTSLLGEPLDNGGAGGGLKWEPVKPRDSVDKKTSSVERGRSRAAGRFSPVGVPHTYDDIQTARAD